MTSADRKLKDWISGFMLFTENSEPPDQFRLWSAISAVASVLQRKCYCKMGTLEFFPNMYIVLVGPSGVRKTTAMGPAWDLLNNIGIELSSEVATMQALIRRMQKASDTVHDYETGEFFMHSSLTVFSKEFTVFIGYDRKDLMSALCDWFDCSSRWSYETISREKETILGVWMNILGATTPKLIHSTMPIDAIGGGLTSRMIMVHEEHKGKFVPFPLLTVEEEALYEDLRTDLEKIHLMRGRFRYEEEFIMNWIEWRKAAEMNPPKFGDDRFDGYLSRRPTHVIKLAMIMSASNRSDMILRPLDLDRAIRALESAEVNMGGVFSGVGKSPIAEIIPQVMAMIRREKEVHYNVLVKTFYRDADELTLERVVRTLEKMGFCLRVETGSRTLIRYKGEGGS